MSIDGAEDLEVVDVTMDSSAGTTGDTDTAATNTDAFDVGSSTGDIIYSLSLIHSGTNISHTGVTISGANVANQDDCLAINSGTTITFTGGSCTGGHGLSIGSVGGRYV